MRFQFTGSLLQLQSNAKRDPEAYLADFQLQLRHFESYLQLFELKPKDSPKQFLELLAFLAQTGPLYPEECKHIPPVLIRLLEAHLDTLQQDTRTQIVTALFTFRTKGVVDCETLLPVCMKLFDIADRQLRQQVFSHLVLDVKALAHKKREAQTVHRIQNTLFTLVKQDEAIPAFYAVMLLIELYRRKIWTSDQAVNAIASGCFSKHTRVTLTAMKFLLGEYKVRLRLQNEKEESEDDDPAEVDKERQSLARKTRHTRLTSKRFNSELKKMQSLKKKVKNATEAVTTIFAPIYVVWDPQGFAERLLDSLVKTRERFEYRLVVMTVIARLIAAHHLLLLNWYPYLERYSEPHIAKVTLVLSLAAQSVHDLVPPETVEPLVRTIANNFVDDKKHPDVIILGINTIREIAKRQPLVMTKELATELADYQRNRDRGVMKAARGIINLYRELNPSLLNRSDRGHDKSRDDELPGFGSSKAVDQVPGVELLYRYEMEHGIPAKRLRQRQEEEGRRSAATKRKAGDGSASTSIEDLYMKDDEWEVESVSTDDDWIDVPDDGTDHIEIDDKSDEEGEDNEGEGAADGEEWVVASDDAEEEGGDDEGADEEGEEGDEEEEDEDSAPELEPAEDRKQRSRAAQPVVESDAYTRILTPADYARIAKLRDALERDPKGRRLLREDQRKRKRVEAADEVVDPDSLEYFTGKRARIDREQKLTERAELRAKHKMKNQKNKRGKGKTNAQKAKAKPGKLTVHKPEIQRKMRQSVGDRKKSQEKGEKSFMKHMIRHH